MCVCMHKGVLANLLLALLHSRSPPPSPPPPPSICLQVWPEGSPSILTGVSKEVSVAILFYTPSLPQQRCCAKQRASFCFSFLPCDLHPDPSSLHLSGDAPSLHFWQSPKKLKAKSYETTYFKQLLQLLLLVQVLTYPMYKLVLERAKLHCPTKNLPSNSKINFGDHST